MASGDLIASFEAYMAARSFSPCTLERRRVALGQFARFIAPMSLLDASGQDIDEWIGTKNAPRTRHAYRSDLAAFYTWAIRRRLVALSSRHMRELGYDCTIHQLRHAYGTEAARVLDGNVVAVGGLMGHSSPNTTQGYIGWAGGETADRLALLYVA